MQKFIKDKWGIEDEVEIDCCDWMKKSGKDWSNNERNFDPQTIIRRLLRFKDKQRIIQSLKKTKEYRCYGPSKTVMGEGIGISIQQQNFLFELSK